MAEQLPGKLVVVLGAALVDEEVDAVHHRVAEGAGHAGAAAAEEGVPEVVGDVGGGGVGGEGVVAALAADGEEHGDVLGLAVLAVGAAGGDVVAGEVEGVAAVAADGEEGDEDGGVEAGVAGLTERALVLVPAPEYHGLAGVDGGCMASGEQQDGRHADGEEE